MNESKQYRPLDFVGSSQEDLRAFPEDVKYDIGYALFQVQKCGKPMSAKPLKGFGSAGVLEIIEKHSSGTYRAVYTVRFEKAVYVLHCFQKKSKKGIQTPKQDINLIWRRLKSAEEDYKIHYQ